MREFPNIQRVFVKSSNSTDKINLNYTYSLIFLVIITIILDLIFGYQTDAINLIKTIIISIAFISICAYLINIIKKKYNFKLIYTEENIIPLSLIISLFSKNYPYYITIISIIIIMIVKIANPKRNLSLTLYGILFIIIYNFLLNNSLINNNITTDNYKIIDFLINPNYVSPILSLLAYIYIFHKKSTKYNIIIPYFLTIFSIIFLYIIINGIDMQFILIGLSINSLIFLSVYTLGDYEITPTIEETQIIYGIITGIITIILYFTITDLSIVIPLIISPLIFTKQLEKMSPKLKYNRKLYNIFITICLIIVICTIIILSVTNCQVFNYII